MILTWYNTDKFMMRMETAMKQGATLGGRPSGRKKTAKIEVLIEPEVKDAFMKKISDEGKSASVEIGVWIRQYLRSTDDDNT